MSQPEVELADLGMRRCQPVEDAIMGDHVVRATLQAIQK